MAYYLTRTAHGTLRYHESVPRLSDGQWRSEGKSRMLPQDLFREVTAENSPVEVTMLYL